MTWPGWDSAESAGWWSTLYFWVGIASLAVMTVAEVLAHVYGLRQEGLLESAKSRIAQEAAQKQQEHEQETARLKQQIADTERKASEDAARLQQQVDEATHRATDAAGQAERLAKAAAPRALTPEQRATLVAVLSPFKGQGVTFQSLPGDADGDHFKREIASALRASGWVFDDATLTFQAFIDPVPSGVQVTMNEGEQRAGRALSSAVAFVKALHQVGITDAATLFVSPEVGPGMIRVVVGNKPALKP